MYHVSPVVVHVSSMVFVTVTVTLFEFPGDSRELQRRVDRFKVA
jgi:hypothetical protein